MGRLVVSRHDSPLGQWTRALCFPAPPLAAHVEIMWFVAGRTTFARDRRLPEGKSHLLFNLGDAPTLFERDGNAAPQRFPTCWFSGQQHSYIETGSGGDTALLGVQFRSHGAYRLLRIAQHELSDRVLELETLLGDRVDLLRQRLLDAAHDRLSPPQACFALLEHWLLELLQRAAAVHPAVLAASQALAADPGDLRLTRLSRDVGLSREHLIRRFRTEIGMTPKAYANVLRFGRALRLARARRGAWSEIAQTCGYFGQAHLVRDFQRYAGRAPVSLLRDRTPDDSSIVVA